MKKIIFQFFFFLFFLVPSLIYCQYSFSTDYIELCNWKENVQKWSNDCEEAPADGLFVVNEAETIITMTNSEGKQTFYIQGENQSDEDSGLVSWDIVSDEGETLYIIFDFNNSKIKLLDLQGKSERWMMAIFNVKSTF